MHASPPCREATRDSSRSRTGSASAFSSGATCSACSMDSGCGGQRGAAGGRLGRADHRQGNRHTSILTGIDVLWQARQRQEIDSRQYLPEVAMSRVQLALNVNDIDEAVTFYTALFGTGPAKRKPGYANFAITEPPLKLVLLENPGQGGTLNHLGVEVADADTVDAEQARLAAGGPGRCRRARHHLLLRPAGQVLGHRLPRRRALGDLHRPGRQRHLLGPGRRTALATPSRPSSTARPPSRLPSAAAGRERATRNPQLESAAGRCEQFREVNEPSRADHSLSPDPGWSGCWRTCRATPGPDKSVSPRASSRRSADRPGAGRRRAGRNGPRGRSPRRPGLPPGERSR